MSPASLLALALRVQSSRAVASSGVVLGVVQGPPPIPMVTPSISAQEEHPTKKVKRNPNMFMNYCRRMREQVKADLLVSKGLVAGSFLDSKEVSTELGRRWHLLSASEKNMYKN